VLRSRVVGSSSDGDDQREGDGGALVMATTADFGTLTTSLQNPPISRVTVRETVLYIGGGIFGVGRPNVADTKDQYFWCRLSLYSRHL
jgi:hypothetical protein